MWRTVRVFISSTFRDMQAERDHLVRFVFPRLREELLKRRIHLVDVDLRWGVTSEQDALEVCREIINECRPRFICILGGRYGWVPPGREHSITADEVRYGVLERLGVKEYRYFYFRDPRATESILEEAAQAGGYREFPTPQDVEAYGPERAQELARKRARKLEDLKRAVREARLEPEPRQYGARWDPESQRLVGLEDFGNRVYADLLASVNDEFGVEPPEALDEFAEEDAAMEAFIEERVERYVVGSRQGVFDELTEFARADGEPGIALVTGAPGCGKSALLGRFSRDHARDHPDDLVITHFVGASAGATDLRRTLRRLCHALAPSTAESREIPQEVKDLVPRFAELLARMGNRRVMLVIDALNQLDATDGAHSMYWLPRKIPANVRVVMSSLEHPALEALRRRGEAFVRRIPVAPLSTADARTIIQAFLQRYRKRMSDEQIAALLQKPSSGSPLYLLAALEELRTLGTYEEISDRIRELPGETRALFDWILQRLEDDPGFRDPEGQLIGGELVREFVSCLDVSRHGLSQMELAELVAPGDAHADPPIPADAQGNVAALIRLLRPYLMQRGELLDFYHGQLRWAAQAKYLDKEQARLDAHRQLAEYFRRKADPHQNRSWKSEIARPFLELPFHMVTGRMGSDLESTLGDFRFLDAKLVACGPAELSKDFDHALMSPEGWLAKAEALELLGQALRLCTDVLAKDSRQLAAQLIGRLLDQHVPLVQELMLSAAREGGRGEPWLRPLRRCLPLGSGRILASARWPHLDMIQGLVITPDGHKIVSWDVDSLCAWSADRLECLAGHQAPGSGCTIQAVAPLPDSQRIVFAMDDTDNTLFIWDVETNRIEEFLHSAKPVKSIAVAHDLLVTAGGNRGPQIWSTARREWLGLAPYECGHATMCVAATQDGSALIGAAAKLVCRWALPGMELQFSRRVPYLRVDRICVTADGRWLLTAAGITHGDPAIRIFDAQSGEPWRSLEGHGGGVVCIATEPNQGWVYSASRDQAVGIWDLPTGRLLRMVKDAGVWALAVTPSGSLVTAGGSCGIQLWDRRSFGRRDEGDVAGPVDAVAVDGKGVTLIAATKGEPPLRWVEGTRTPMDLKVNVARLALTDDGEIALVASTRGEIVVWNTSEGRPVGELEGEGPTVTFLAVSQSGEVVVARKDGSIRVWRIRDTQRPRCLASGTAARNPVAVSPDGQVAVCTGSHAYDDLAVYDAKSRSLLRHLPLGKLHQTLGTVAFSVDGTRVALARGSWRVRGGSTVLVVTLDEASKMVGELHNRTDDVTGLAFSHDGKRLVICDASGMLLVWDIEKGKLIRHYGSAAFRSCAVSRDGQRIAAGDVNGFIHLLQLETGQSSTGGRVQYGDPSPEISVRRRPSSQPEESARPAVNSHATEDWQRVTNETLAAIRSGSAELMTHLLASCPGLVHRDICAGLTLLHYAVEDGYRYVVRVLIEHGANVNAKDKRGFTPLHRAAYKGDVHIAALLVTAGASIDSLDDAGMAPIHVAAFEGHTGVVKLLLAQASAPVDQRDSVNRTPLHAAASGCRVDTAIFLLSQGADVNAVADDGGTPLDWAWHRRDAQSMIELLREHGGKLKKTG